VLPLQPCPQAGDLLAQGELVFRRVVEDSERQVVV